MPIYEYECENCGTHFDKIQSMKDEPVRLCPECSGVVHKVFHPAGIIFKGSGWYINDSRKSTTSTVAGETQPADQKKESKTETATEGKSDTKSETKTDTKVETKTETKPAPVTESK